MPYLFYYHAATSKTASQHPCRLFFAAATVAAPFFLMSGPASADLNCTEKPTCEALGYHKSISVISCPFDTSYTKCIVESATTDDLSCEEMGFTTTDKSEWCGNVITCPKDKAYTLCASGYDCSAFTLDKCPTGANCDSCLSEGKLSYAVTSCKEGYIGTYVSLDGAPERLSCSINPCNGYGTSCIANANCSTCQSGSTTKYKFDSCKDGYVMMVNTNGTITCGKQTIVKCLGYPLTSCKSPATACDECDNNGKTVYKAKACALGYEVKSGTCVEKDCSAFPLASCPENGFCKMCPSGNKKSYQLSSCTNGYTKAGNSCVCDGWNCTDGATGQKGCFAKNPCVTGQFCTWRCSGQTTYDDGNTSSGGSTGGGGGGSACSDVCQPATMNSCACKLCQDSRFCSKDPGNFCCQTREEEDSVDTGMTTNPYNP